MKKGRRQIGFLVVVLLLISCLIVFGGSAASNQTAVENLKSSSSAVDSNYDFKSVSVKIDVSREKKLNVTETLNVNFDRDYINTGIIRDIQRISKTTRIIKNVKENESGFGQSFSTRHEVGSKFIADLTDVQVTLDGGAAKVTQSLYSNGYFHSIKMQTPNRGYIKKGEHTFVLSYVYNMGDDKQSGYDDLTFDILGYAMNFVDKFDAEITFPVAPIEKNISYRTNDKMLASNYSARIEGNTLKFSANPKSSEKGYTLQVLFDEGTFTRTRTFYWYYVLFYVFAILCFAACIFIVLKFRTQKPIEPVEFYPPAEAIDPVLFSVFYRGKARAKDIPALILLWAKQGHLTIERDGKKDLILYKKKDLPRMADYEHKSYFDSLFARKSRFSTKIARKKANLTMRREVGEAARKIKQTADSTDIYMAHFTLARVLFAAFSVLPVLFVLGYYAILVGDIVALLFGIFVICGTFVAHLVRIISFGFIFAAGPFIGFIGIFYMPRYDYAFLLFVAMAFYLLCLFYLQFLLGKRNELGQKTLGKIRGFKNFLLAAEVERIEALLQENPEYYYDVLPYCMVLGISKKVEKRYAALNVAAPDWVVGFTAGTLASSLTRSLSSSARSSMGVGSSGGGGSSGSSGGGGGGGGSRGC